MVDFFCIFIGHCLHLFTTLCCELDGIYSHFALWLF